MTIVGDGEFDRQSEVVFFLGQPAGYIHDADHGDEWSEASHNSTAKSGDLLLKGIKDRL